MVALLSLDLLLELLLILHLLVKIGLWLLIHHDLDLLPNELLLLGLFLVFIVLEMTFFDIIEKLLEFFVGQLIEIELQLLLITVIILWLVVLDNRQDTPELFVVQGANLGDQHVTVLVKGRHRFDVELFVVCLRLAATLVNRDGTLTFWTASSFGALRVRGHKPINIDVILLQLLVDLGLHLVNITLIAFMV